MGSAAAEREAAVESLERTGLVDDGRFARARAERSPGGERGTRSSDTTSCAPGLEHELVETAIDGLEPEEARARAVVERAGTGPKNGAVPERERLPGRGRRSAVAGGRASELG